jgi:hypothetical protein
MLQRDKRLPGKIELRGSIRRNAAQRINKMHEASSRDATPEFRAARAANHGLTLGVHSYEQVTLMRTQLVLAFVCCVFDIDRDDRYRNVPWN